MRLLIADDHDLALDGLKLVLAQIGPDVTVVECGDFDQAVELAKQNDDLDLVVLDLNMPGMAGVSGVEVFRSLFPNAPTLIMSGYYRHQDIVNALRLGAAGFVPKTLSREAMLNAFRLVLSGERFIPAEFLPDSIPARGGRADAASGGDRAGPFESLSRRERDVMRELLKGLTNKEIGRHLGIREVTVKLHLSKVYRKTGAKNRAHAVKIAGDHGFES